MSIDTLIRVVLVDDQQDVHDAVAAILGSSQTIHLVGQAYNGDDAIRLCEMTTPDLVLMDVVMPGSNAARTTQTLLKTLPDLKVLVLSNYQEYEFIKDMMESGATGYIVKTAITAELITTIQDTMQGKVVLSREVARQIIDPPDSSDQFNLTERETEILKLMSSGLTDGQIAATLTISQRTVRFHFANLLQKFDVETRSQMLVLAAKSGIV